MTTRRRLIASPGTQIFYVVDWLPPDFGAVGQYGLLAARALADAGENVRLIGLTTAAPRTTQETLARGNRIEIDYIASAAYLRADLCRRLLWTLKTNFRLLRAVITDPRSRRAKVTFTGAPPFLLFFVIALKWLRRVHLTYRITDFYPEVLIAELGSRWWLSALQRLTWLVRRQVDQFEALGEDQRALLTAGGIAPERIRLERDISPVTFGAGAAPARRPAALSNHKILLYSGNYSTAHDAETVVEGLIRHHRAGGRFGLWLNATGSKADAVEAALRDASFPVVRTVPGSLAELPSLLLAADAHLISLRSQFAGIVLPSKVYGCIASRKPVLFVGPAASDVHLLCREAELPAYERVQPGDPVGFAEALDRLTAL